MPTSTTNYALQKPLVNNPTDEDLWGDEINDDLDDIDSLLKQGITLTPQVTQTTGFTATSTISVKYLYPCDATSAAFAATLPTAAAAGFGAMVFFKKTDASTNAVTVTRAASDTIDNATTFTLTARYEVVGLSSDGVSNWNIIVRPSGIPYVTPGTVGNVLTSNGTIWVSNANKVMQTVYYQTGAVATGSTQIPFDDSIPQNTEGNEYMTLAITPISASSKLKIDVTIFLSAPGKNTAALFQDSTADALAAGSINVGNQNVNCITFSHIADSVSIASHTYKIRAGGSEPGTTTFNGESGSRVFGGVMASSIVISEFTP